MGELTTAVPAPASSVSSGFSGLALENIASGQPLYLNRVNGKLGLAVAMTEEKSTCVGLAASSIALDAVGLVDDEQHQELDWTAVTGTVNLTPGLLYYLDLTIPGRLTTVAPSDGEVGKFAAAIGVAVTTKIMEINIQPPIGL